MIMEELKPRQLDIMQNLAIMLEKKGPVKITTSLIAKECGISEAAIYRHFPSKRKIFSGLVDFCEKSLFDLIANINSSNEEPLNKVLKIIIVLFKFCEKNPGIARLLTREVFSIEEAPLEERIKQLFDRIELHIKQHFQKYEQITKKKLALSTASCANLVLACTEGIIQKFVRTGFVEKSLQKEEQISFLLGALIKK